MTQVAGGGGGGDFRFEIFIENFGFERRNPFLLNNPTPTHPPDQNWKFSWRTWTVRWHSWNYAVYRKVTVPEFKKIHSTNSEIPIKSIDIDIFLSFLQWNTRWSAVMVRWNWGRDSVTRGPHWCQSGTDPKTEGQCSGKYSCVLVCACVCEPECACLCYFCVISVGFLCLRNLLNLCGDSYICAKRWKLK